MDTKVLFDSAYVPPASLLQNLIKEINQTLQDPEIQPQLQKLLITFTSNEERNNSVLKPLIALFNTPASKLNKKMEPFAHALSHYHQDWIYQNHAGKTCRALAPAFSNLAMLLENDKKRLALETIVRFQQILQNSSFKTYLLVRQQLECLTQLGIDIVYSAKETSLQSVYDAWKQQPILYLQKNVNTDDLMQQVEQSGSTWMTKVASPNMALFCQQIEKLAQQNQAVTSAFETLKK